LAPAGGKRRYSTINLGIDDEGGSVGRLPLDATSDKGCFHGWLLGNSLKRGRLIGQ
jgi:hypothetical protein